MANQRAANQLQQQELLRQAEQDNYRNLGNLLNFAVQGTQAGLDVNMDQIAQAAEGMGMDPGVAESMASFISTGVGTPEGIEGFKSTLMDTGLSEPVADVFAYEIMPEIQNYEGENPEKILESMEGKYDYMTEQAAANDPALAAQMDAGREQAFNAARQALGIHDAIDDDGGASFFSPGGARGPFEQFFGPLFGMETSGTQIPGATDITGLSWEELNRLYREGR